MLYYRNYFKLEIFVFIMVAQTMRTKERSDLSMDYPAIDGIAKHHL